MYPHGQYPPQPQPEQYPPFPGAPAQPGYPGGAYLGAPWPPPPPPKSHAGKVLTAALAGAVLLAGGSFTYRQFASSDAASAGACVVSGARIQTMDRKSDNEPTVTIPVRSGWDKVLPDEIPGAPKGINDPSIRGLVLNGQLQKNAFTPNIVVTLDAYPDNDVSPEAINAAADRTLARSADIGERTAQEVCGNTVFNTAFSKLDTAATGQTQSGNSMLTTIDGPDGTRWVATATIQTRDPDDPEFTAQRDALVEGFHLSFPPPP